MLLLHRENREVVLFDDDLVNLMTLNIIFVVANILIEVETKKNKLTSTLNYLSF
jgi:hypothetical protein